MILKICFQVPKFLRISSCFENPKSLQEITINTRTYQNVYEGLGPLQTIFWVTYRLYQAPQIC